MTKLKHPVIPGLIVTVPPKHVPEWLASGWLRLRRRKPTDPPATG